ncbi:Gfo/Idh/MocA family protein [Cerasicoccus frondis]|uniref:Gfo/Idh/MocA family protein n=1 Tax=Cerasicoccus frondis TaxID=490090 RepID=UPI0028525428|nr:Gfo/Idh/MocA family oxidoreductase [Cerasicoccus frondis]
MVKIALIGVAGFGSVYHEALRTLQDNGLVQIVAATVINRVVAVKSCHEVEAVGCRIYDDYREMLSAEHGNIDLCAIPTGIALHCRMTIAALQAGCHVLVENPVAGSVEEVYMMIAARDRALRCVFVGFHDLYQKSIMETKKRILAREIGELRSVRVLASWPRPDIFYDRNNWAGKSKVGEDWVYDFSANNALAHFLIATLVR